MHDNVEAVGVGVDKKSKQLICNTQHGLYLDVIATLLKAYLARRGSSHAPVGLATGRYTHDGEVLSEVLYRDTLAIQIGELGLVADILISLKCNCHNIPASGRPKVEEEQENKT
jgi:hypothetical protein